jgi:hypothetical protein
MSLEFMYTNCTILTLLFFMYSIEFCANYMRASMQYSPYLFAININLYNCVCIVVIVCIVLFIVCVILCDVYYLCVVSYCSTTATG